MVRFPVAVAALVMVGTAVGAAVMVSAKVAEAGPPVPLAVSVILVVPTVAFMGNVPEITPVVAFKVKPVGRVEVL